MQKVIIFLSVAVIVGCAPGEISRLMGVGTNRFKTHGSIYERDFQGNYSGLYEEVVEFFRNIEASPYRGTEKSRFVVARGFKKAFTNCADATEVAVFFEEIDESTVNIKVSSFNSRLSRFVSSELFYSLEQNL